MGILAKCFGVTDSKHASSSHHVNKHTTQIEELCRRFSLAQLRKATNNFNDSQIIGRGSFGTVYKGCICIEGVATEIAIKRLVSEFAMCLDWFRNETELLCQLRHPNLISLIGFCNDKNECILVYEYMSNGSIYYNLCNKERYRPLPWKRRVEICIGAARALHYLHAGAKRTILHRDVNPHNILLDQNWISKLSDLELGMKGPHFMSKPRPITVGTICGTSEYMAPEHVISGTFTEKCDVFSFGGVLLVVVCAIEPFTIIDLCRSVDVRESGSQHFQGSSDKNLASQVDSDETENVSGIMSDDTDADESEGVIGIRSDDTPRPSSKNLASLVYNIVQNGKADMILDPFLLGKIAPECWRMFMDIAERCLRFEPNERPTMGEVELELEHALALQEEADQTNPSGEYSLLSTVNAPQPENASQNQGFSANKCSSTRECQPKPKIFSK